MPKLRFLLVISLFFSVTMRAQEIPYTACPGCWDPDSLGNHRACIRFDGPGDYARALIPWRLRDSTIANHRIIIQDGKTGARITNVFTSHIGRESGEVYFQPTSGKGAYYVYY